MIVIDSIKYACITCIKGHRSSQCSHRDRHLLPIRRKGRPISQCEKCREQRMMNSIHQKCICRRASKKKSATEKKQLKQAFTARKMMAIEALLI